MTKYIGLFFMIFIACTPLDKKKEEKLVSSKADDYYRIIEGIDEEIDPDIIKRGEVLIAYSDCLDCHKIGNRSKGPAFLDIAKRYPFQQVYINLLAQKIISGGSGSWGNPVMSPHPEINEQNAKEMVSYILSLEE
jgi:cytochrome c